MSTTNPFKSLQALANLTALLETNKIVVLLPSADGSQGTLESLGNISIADFKSFLLAQVNQEITDLQNKPGNGAFASPINFNLTGPVAGTVAFDGSTDVTLPTSIADGALSIGMVSGLGTQLTALQSDLDGKFDTAMLGVAGGAASLDVNGLIPTYQLPSYVDDVIDVADYASLPATGTSGKIYVAADTGNIYRWSGSTYVWINNSVSSADTATRWATARSFTLGGVATGTTTLDGSADINLTVALVDNSIDNIKLKFSSITFGATAVNLGDTVTALSGLASVTSTLFIGALTGNADTATKWASAITLTLGGVLSGSATIDGSGNVTLSASMPDDAIATSAVFGLDEALAGKLDGTATAVAAAKWATPMTLTVEGPATGSVMFDGSTAATLTLSIADGALTQTMVSGLTDALGTLQSNINAKLSTSVYTAADVLAKLLTVDGSTSALDADLLDGQEGSFYQNADNLNAGTIPVARAWALTGDVTATAGSGTTVITDKAVTLAKLADLPLNTLIGRQSDSAGVPQAIAIGTNLLLSGGVLSATNYGVSNPDYYPNNSALDCNTLVAGSKALVSTTGNTNVPTGTTDAFWYIETVNSYDGSALAQRAIGYTTGKMQTRALAAGTWSSWNDLSAGGGGGTGVNSLNTGWFGLQGSSGSNVYLELLNTANSNTQPMYLVPRQYGTNVNAVAVSTDPTTTNGDVVSFYNDGTVKLLNGSGLVSVAGAKITTGPGGGTWSITRAASSNAYLTLTDELGNAVWTWDVDGSLNTTAAANVGSGTVGKDGTNGYLSWVQGNPSRPGYVEFHTADGIRRGYIGWANAAINSLLLTAENGWNLELGSPTTINTTNWWSMRIVATSTTNAYFGADSGGLTLGCNTYYTGSAWAVDDTTKKAFAYIAHMGNGRYEWRVTPVGGAQATSAWLNETQFNHTGAVSAGDRIFTGYDSGVTGSISCSQWFRSNGQTGWYNATYAGGWYMTDTTYVRSYSNKAVVASDFVISSDARLKTAVMPFQYKGRLNPVNYTLIENGKSGFGFIAQEVQRLYPEAVGVIKESGMLQVSYSKLTTILSYQINALEDEFTKLRTEMEELRALVHRKPWWKRLFQRKAPATK